MTEDFLGVSQTALNIFRGGLIASLQGDLDDELLARLRQDVLEKIQSRALTGVIFDMSTVRVLDTHTFDHLVNTVKMAKLLGAESFFVGLQPGVVSFLVDMDVDTTSIQTLLTLEDGLKLITALSLLRELPKGHQESSASISEYSVQEGSIDNQE